MNGFKSHVVACDLKPVVLLPGTPAVQWVYRVTMVIIIIMAGMEPYCAAGPVLSASLRCFCKFSYSPSGWAAISPPLQLRVFKDKREDVTWPKS